MLNGTKKTLKSWRGGAIIVWEHPKTGKLHHLDGPADIEEAIEYRSYLINGKWHNINGPARIWGKDRKEYYINSRYCKRQQWLLISLKRKLIDKKKY